MEHFGEIKSTEGLTLDPSHLCYKSTEGLTLDPSHLCYEFKGRDLFRLEEVDPATGATIG